MYFGLIHVNIKICIQDKIVNFWILDGSNVANEIRGRPEANARADRMEIYLYKLQKINK